MSETPLELSALPLFPLGSVLFPGGVLPLRIFEVRYLDMISRCHRHGAPFGVVALREGREVQQPDGDGFAEERFEPVGTLARIDVLEAPHPGLLMVRCSGTQRFQVLRSERMRHGLWVADVRCVVADATMAVPPDLLPVAEALRRLVESLKARGVGQDQMPLTEPLRAEVACRWRPPGASARVSPRGPRPDHVRLRPGHRIARR
jgi:uncharacterized protein